MGNFVYTKLTFIFITIAILFGIGSGIIFANVDLTTGDHIYDTTLEVLIFIQKYSWPILTLLLIYALYLFYILGGGVRVEARATGQRMIVMIATFAVIIQVLPLAYAFISYGINA